MATGAVCTLFAFQGTRETIFSSVESGHNKLTGIADKTLQAILDFFLSDLVWLTSHYLLLLS